MHIHIGMYHPAGFKVTLDDGTDVTQQLRIIRASISVEKNDDPIIKLECYASIDASIEDGKLIVGEPGPLTVEEVAGDLVKTITNKRK